MTLREETGATRAVTTSEGGTYTFDAIPTGIYTVEMEAKGSRRLFAENEVRIGQPTTVNAAIDIGQVTETVEVLGAAETVQTSTSGNYGNVLTERSSRTCRLWVTRTESPEPGPASARDIRRGEYRRRISCPRRTRPCMEFHAGRNRQQRPERRRIEFRARPALIRTH